MFAILSQPMALLAMAVGAVPSTSLSAEGSVPLRHLSREELRQFRAERDAFRARHA